MASTPFPIVLNDHTKAGIRWRVSIHPELGAEGTVVVRFLKRGRAGRLLDQLCRWSPQGGWARCGLPGQCWICGLPPFTMVNSAPRHERLAELRRQLAELNAKGRQTAPGSPERDAVMEEWEPSMPRCWPWPRSWRARSSHPAPHA